MRTATRGLSTSALLMLVLVAGSVSCGTTRQDEHQFPELTGEYLGQQPPGDEARLFAPGIISTGVYTRDVAMTPDGRELYFSVVFGNYDFYAIMVTKMESGRWTEPEVAPFSGRYKDLEPAISPDGSKFFFFSHRPPEGEEAPNEDSDIWVMDRTEDGWGDPYNLGAPVNTEMSEYFPSVTTGGSLYFTRDGDNRTSHIYRSRPVEGGYSEPERLGPNVNSTVAQYNAFVAPDESYLIFSAYGRQDSLGGSDYYISFRNEDDSWTGPINMGRRVNSASPHEYSAYVSPDGRYLFFMATENRFADGFPGEPVSYTDIRKMHGEPRNGYPDIYWIDAGFIEDLRP